MSLAIQSETADTELGARITLEGRLDTVTALELEKRLESLLDGRYSPLVFDLARLEFISSAGIRVLIRAHQTMSDQRGRVRMENPQPQIAKVFDIVRALPGVAVFKNESELRRSIAMLLIRVVSIKDQPIGRELAARFGESGGTIGRGENSVLILPDPDRYVSRTHAIISFQAGGFVITDRGTKNPTFLNGRRMGAGSQARLNDGDEIKIGEYTLEVSLASVRPVQSSAEVGVAQGGGGLTSTAPDPFDLWGPDRPAVASWPGIQPIIRPVSARLPPDPLADPRVWEPKIDDVVDLKPSGTPDPFGRDGPLGWSSLNPEGSRAVDPCLFGPAKSAPSPTTPPDHGKEVFTPYIPPAARLDPALEIRPEPPRAVTPPASLPPSMPAVLPSMEPPPLPGAGSVPSTAVDTSLLRAFLEGAGIPDTRLPNGLTAESMATIGKLLREAVQGTLDLLRARGLVKTEMRADVTQIMPLDNNPLKFSPTVEAALLQLLAPQGHGFIPPLPAIKNAYQDLRAHQIGVLAGMRAALGEVVARFSPDELQRRLADHGMLDTLLPMNRKAKLWDLFVERYEQVGGEAREDFNAAFGKAFRGAYEAQVKQLSEVGQR